MHPFSNVERPLNMSTQHIETKAKLQPKVVISAPMDYRTARPEADDPAHQAEIAEALYDVWLRLHCLLRACPRQSPAVRHQLESIQNLAASGQEG